MLVVFGATGWILQSSFVSSLRCSVNQARPSTPRLLSAGSVVDAVKATKLFLDVCAKALQRQRHALLMNIAKMWSLSIVS